MGPNEASLRKLIVKIACESAGCAQQQHGRQQSGACPPNPRCRNSHVVPPHM